jgi:hypothetical protein
LVDFGSLEVQAVYISGNVRRPFENYMQQRLLNQEIIWTEAKDADIAWSVYDLVLDEASNCYSLSHQETVYTLFKTALDRITTPLPGSLDTFMNLLQEKLDERLEDNLALTSLSLTDVLNEG